MDQSKLSIRQSQYSVNKSIGFKTPMLRSDLCDYSDAYIVVKKTTDLEVDGNNNTMQKGVVFKNNAPFRVMHSKR